MKTTIFSFEVLAMIIAVTILQACAEATTTTQCAKPTLIPSGVSAPVTAFVELESGVRET